MDMTENFKDLLLLGEGRTASVYAIDDSKALKLFYEGWTEEQVRKIFLRNAASEKAGIPVVHIHETVTENRRYGLVMDRMEESSLDMKLAAASSIDERMELVDRFAEMAADIHKTKVEGTDLPDQKEFALSLIKLLPEAGHSRDEIHKIRSVIEAVPDGNGYIHGDLHTGNVILAHGKMLLSDLGEFTGRGHYLWDLCCMYSHYVFFPSIMDGSSVKKYIGMSREEGKQVYDEFIKVYFAGEAPEIIKMTEKIQAVKVCLAHALYPGIFNKGAVLAVLENLG